eukprot:NP_001343733.1 Uncharacterized protein CELE_Y48G8AR.8 [Caenorhabditis elegans]
MGGGGGGVLYDGDDHKHPHHGDLMTEDQGSGIGGYGRIVPRGRVFYFPHISPLYIFFLGENLQVKKKM